MLAVFAALMISVALTACGSSKISSADKTKLYNACHGAGASAGDCHCLVNYLADHYTVSQFKTAATTDKSGKEPAIVLTAAKACHLT
jgi:hypothetical protein